MGNSGEADYASSGYACSSCQVAVNGSTDSEIVAGLSPTFGLLICNLLTSPLTNVPLLSREGGSLSRFCTSAIFVLVFRQCKYKKQPLVLCYVS